MRPPDPDGPYPSGDMAATTLPKPPSNIPNLALARQRQPTGQSLFSEDTWRVIAAALKLSRRELQIVRRVFDDRKESAIAMDLGISPHTVNTYLHRLYQKLGVTGRSQLIVVVVGQYLALNGQAAQAMQP